MNRFEKITGMYWQTHGCHHNQNPLPARSQVRAHPSTTHTGVMGMSDRIGPFTHCPVRSGPRTPATVTSVHRSPTPDTRAHDTHPQDLGSDLDPL